MEQASRLENMRKRHRKTALVQWLFCILLVLLAIGFTLFVWFTPIKIETDAMTPTFSSGEIVFYNRFYKHVKSVERSDVIVYYDANGAVRIGRVVALAGERVEIREGTVYINNRYRVDESAYADAAVFYMQETVIPQNSLFILSDNRLMHQSNGTDGAVVGLNEVMGVVQFNLTDFTFYG
ncbi:MAG: signal peptidase I [Clostridia bacterium]|nr:signal peptidase I [Clostridia bacterium]